MSILTDFSIESEFVPYSKSWNAKPNPKLDDLSLNFVVKLFYKGKEVLKTNYTMGVGNAWSYKNRQLDRVKKECEDRLGFPVKVEPNLKDLLENICIGLEVLNYGSFEEWATDLGYNTDSRMIEKIYQKLLAQSLKFRAAVGSKVIHELTLELEGQSHNEY